jgi:hypothetical protein
LYISSCQDVFITGDKSRQRCFECKKEGGQIMLEFSNLEIAVCVYHCGPLLKDLSQPKAAKFGYILGPYTGNMHEVLLTTSPLTLNLAYIRGLPKGKNRCNPVTRYGIHRTIPQQHHTATYVNSETKLARPIIGSTHRSQCKTEARQTVAKPIPA